MDKRAQFVVGMMRELNQILEINTKLSIAYHLQINGQMEKINQKLEQYLRIFIDHHQEQWSDQLATAVFVYNNKVQTSTKVSLFKANNRQDPCIEFKIRKKRKFERAKKFAKKIKEIYKKAEAVLRKSQEEIKKYANKKRSKPKEYKVGDQVLLSTKDFKFQIKERHSEKLIKQFVGPYKMKRIISTNTNKNTSSSKHQQSTNVQRSSRRPEKRTTSPSGN